MVPKKSQSPKFCLCGALLRKVPNAKSCIIAPAHISAQKNVVPLCLSEVLCFMTFYMHTIHNAVQLWIDDKK